MDNRPTFGHLCVIARQVITENPLMDDAEWREAIKCRLVVLRFDYPERYETIPAAMAAVERALTKLWGPRPVPDPPKPPQTVPPQQDDPPWRRCRQPSGRWSALPQLLANLSASPCSNTSPAVAPESHEARVNRQIQEWHASQTTARPLYRVTTKGFERVL